MADLELPLGVRFKPESTELLGYFLRARLDGKPLPPCYPQLMDFDVYTDHPFNILASTKERRGVPDDKGGGMAEGYFFSRLKKMSRNANKKNNCRHIQGHGTWSEHSATINVLDENERVIGIRKYFKFDPVAGRKNAAENEDEWQMYEFYLAGKDEMVLCHIYKKKESLSSSRKRNRNNNAPPVIKKAYYQGSASKQSRINYDSSPQYSSVININIPAQPDVKGKAIMESSYEGGTTKQGRHEYDYSSQFNKVAIMNPVQLDGSYWPHENSQNYGIMESSYEFSTSNQAHAEHNSQQFSCKPAMINYPAQSFGFCQAFDDGGLNNQQHQVLHNSGYDLDHTTRKEALAEDVTVDQNSYVKDDGTGESYSCTDLHGVQASDQFDIDDDGVQEANDIEAFADELLDILDTDEEENGIEAFADELLDILDTDEEENDDTDNNGLSDPQEEAEVIVVDCNDNQHPMVQVNVNVLSEFTKEDDQAYEIEEHDAVFLPNDLSTENSWTRGNYMSNKIGFDDDDDDTDFSSWLPALAATYSTI